jgi:hypothetical protein
MEISLLIIHTSQSGPKKLTSEARAFDFLPEYPDVKVELGFPRLALFSATEMESRH